MNGMLTMSVEEKATVCQDKLESKFSNIGKGKYGRIVKMCRTPTGDEFKKTIMITAAGVLVLGLAGYAIYWIMSYLPGFF